MKILKEFREFAMRGNVVDMAVGVIIGGAFGTIVNSVINDLIMPLIGKAIGNVDFSNLYIALSSNIPAKTSLAEARKLGAVFAYGNFITVLLNFLILAFCIFGMIKAMNMMMRRPPPAPAVPPAPTRDQALLAEIRDILRGQGGSVEAFRAPSGRS